MSGSNSSFGRPAHGLSSGGGCSVDSDALNAMDRAHFLHPWQMFDVFPKEGALAIVSGKNCHITDSDDNRYFDAVGGLWCNNIGLGRREMAEAIAEQAYKMAYANPFVDMTNEPAAQLAQKLAQLAPGDIEHVIFTTGGSTAIDSAFRLVHYYQNCRGKSHKKHILSRQGSYHGSTYAAMSIGGKKGDHPPEFDYISDCIHHLSCPNFYRAPEGMDEAQFVAFLLDEFEQKVIQLGTDNVAAFFAEPVMGAGGVIVPPDGYLKGVRALCTRYDILYVSDEVVTGFGRLGHWFASLDEFGIQPDIIVCAKGITSGYQPLGAALFSEKIWQVISEPGRGRVFAHGFTYSGHPVACAAALKNIEIIERENLLANVRDVAPYFSQRLKTLQNLPTVGQVRGRGFMQCIESVADKKTKRTFAEELDIGKRIANAAQSRGLIVRPIVHLNVMSPPLTMTKADVDFIVPILRESMEEVGRTMPKS